MTTKERSIALRLDEVRAMLSGRKTQLRRVVKCECNRMHNGRLLGAWGLSRPPFRWDGDPEDVNWQHCGREAKIGDWVEQYQTDVDDHASRVVPCPFGTVDSVIVPRRDTSIRMAVKSIRVERLQEITEADAMAEGMEPGCLTCGENCLYSGGCGWCRPCYRESFIAAWQKRPNGRELWLANPWVWVVEFTRVTT